MPGGGSSDDAFIWYLMGHTWWALVCFDAVCSAGELSRSLCSPHALSEASGGTSGTAWAAR